MISSNEQMNDIFTPSQKIYFVFKRFFDIIFSIIGLFLFLILSIIIKIIYVINNDNGSIIYKHIRVGKNGKLFSMYKYRTMVVDADEKLKELLKDEEIRSEWEVDRKLKNDPRVTKGGRFFRKTSLDELPQFINVLKGDMSIIGPRPLVKGELESKNGLKLYETIRPGITGWWACNGRSDITYDERLDLEYYYIKNCSFLLDIKCFFRTIYIVLIKKGAR